MYFRWFLLLLHVYDHSFICKNFFYLHVVVVKYLAVQFVFCLNNSTLAYSFKDLTNQSPPCTANYKVLNVLPENSDNIAILFIISFTSYWTEILSCCSWTHSPLCTRSSQARTWCLSSQVMTEILVKSLIKGISDML